MSRALGPSGGLPSEATTPFVILSLCWVPVAALGAVWAGGNTATWLAGGGWTGPAFGWSLAAGLFEPDGVRRLWPDSPVALVWTCAAFLVALAVLPLFVGWLAWRRSVVRPDDPARSLAGGHELAGLAPSAIARRAQQLRPTLAEQKTKDVAGRDTGVPLGTLRAPGRSGPMLRASWEDVVLAVMAPRAGKTTGLAVPAILDAPGAVVATSNKADLWATTHAARHRDTGERVWVFDPQQIAHAERTWWWNPLAGLTSVEEAHRLAGHFITEVRSENSRRDFWTSAAHDLLTGLLLAAATGVRDLADVYTWLNDPVIPTPIDLLRRGGHHAVAESLHGRMLGAPETRDGVYETARTAAQCLRDPDILAWVSPPGDTMVEVEAFDAAAFATSRQTLYLLSKDGAGAAAPLVAALTDRVTREATRAAERAGGRLDPPLLLVLDEAANICRIADLPDLYSHLGSRGIIPITVLQSYKQGVRVWGEHGMDTLWSAATIKLIGAGLDDARLAEDVSRLVGDHDVPVRSSQRGDRSTSTTVSLRRQRILPPERLRALPRGTALLLATGLRAGLLALRPWYAGPRAAEITDDAAAAAHQLTDRASQLDNALETR